MSKPEIGQNISLIFKVDDGNHLVSTFKYTGEEFENSEHISGGILVSNYYKFKDLSNEFSYIWVDHNAFSKGLVIYNYLEQENNGVYHEEDLIDMGFFPNKTKPLLDFNNIPPLTQKEIDDFEPERLRLEKEIRDHEKEKIKEEKIKKSSLVSLENEKKKRCKKDKS